MINNNIHIVFDLDGTLADTQIIHQTIESNFLNSKGVYLEPLYIGKTYAGRSTIQWIPELFKDRGISFEQKEIEDFVAGKDEKVITLLNQGKIFLMPFAKETLEILSKKGYKIGISSGACRKFIDNFIQYFSLGMIEASTSADEVERKKPNPDVFDKSFEILKTKYGIPKTKYVVGDGKSDIIGGHASGAITILFNNSNIFTVEISNILNFEIKQLDELPTLIA